MPNKDEPRTVPKISGQSPGTRPFQTKLCVLLGIEYPIIQGALAGGIVDTRGFMAALCLGACGVQMGTRFVATAESAASPEEKQKVLEAMDEDNVVTEIFTGKPVRVLTSPRLDSLLKSMKGGLSPEETHSGIMELRKKKRKKEPGYTSVTSGQGAGLVHDILPAGEVIQEIISGAEALYKGLYPYVSG